MRRSNLLAVAAASAFAGANGFLGFSSLPAVRVSRGLGPDGTEFDPGRTTPKRTKRRAFEHKNPVGASARHAAAQARHDELIANPAKFLHSAARQRLALAQATARRGKRKGATA